MSTTRTSTVVEARRRAREARAALDAERARHDERVDEVAVRYYAAVGTVEELREQITTAEADAEAAVLTLLTDLKETPERVAQLTGLSVKEVRRVRRTTAPAARNTGPTAGTGMGNDQDEAPTPDASGDDAAADA